jgi:hypothetical protein
MHAAARATRAQPSLAGDPRRAGRAREGREAEGRGEGRAAREARRAQPLRKVVSLPRAAASPREPTGAVFPTVPLRSACARPPANSHVARASCALLCGRLRSIGRVRGSRAAYWQAQMLAVQPVPHRGRACGGRRGRRGSGPRLQDSLGGAHGCLVRGEGTTGALHEAVLPDGDGWPPGTSGGKDGPGSAATHKPDSAECAAPVGVCCGALVGCLSGTLCGAA